MSPDDDHTPLPGPLPHHVADPTTTSIDKLSLADLVTPDPDEARPTLPRPAQRAGSEDTTMPELFGRAGEDDIDLLAELETRQRPRIGSEELRVISQPPPQVTEDRTGKVRQDTEDEVTRPHPLAEPRGPSTEKAILASPFFSTLPPHRREALLARLQRRGVAAGDVLIRAGETAHPLVLVGSGRLEIRGERDGQLVVVGSVGAGDYVGEASLLARAPAATTVVAATAAELWLVPPRELYELAGAFPALWAQLKDVAQRRTREHQRLLGR